MSEKFQDIGFAVFLIVASILILLPTSAFVWLITVSCWDAALKITGAWK